MKTCECKNCKKQELIRRKRAKRRLMALAKKSQEIVKAKGLTIEDFGGPFEE